jgi:hypothetical protein
MSQNRLPEIKDPLAQIANLAINPMIKPEDPNIKMEIKNVVEEIHEEPVNSEMVFGKKPPGVSKDEMVNESLPVPEESNAIKKGQGKRGKDKKKRKKKVMSEAQLASLAKGRAASLAKRQAKAQSRTTPVSAPIPIIAPPQKAQALDYSTFSNYMDMYEEKKKKKYSTSTQPHPNKVINERHRPTPPRSKPRPQPKQPSLMNWNGNISAYQSHKKTGKSRWNYGI